MSGQNTSSAVMQQRKEPHDSLDDFPTPPWATRALCEWLIANRFAYEGDIVCEPACNRGHMVKPLRERFGVICFDVHDYGCGFDVRDYLFGEPPACEWTITNPPFRLAQEFIEQGLKGSRRGVAVIVRSAFLEGVARWRDLFSATPPAYVLQFTERVVMHKGRLSKNGSTATAYCWIIWIKGAEPVTRFQWISPCRKRLERASDYPEAPKAAARSSEGGAAAEVRSAAAVEISP